MISSPRARWRMLSRRALAAPATPATPPATARPWSAPWRWPVRWRCWPAAAPAAPPPRRPPRHRARQRVAQPGRGRGSPQASTVPASASPAATGTSAAACPTRSLSVKPGLAQGAAGSIYQVLDFTNISNVTCTLYGYPGVSLAGGKPVTQIGLAAARTHNTPVTLVTLAPRAVASALLRIVAAGNFPAAKCQLVKATYLQIYPPNQTTPIYLAYQAQACAKPEQVVFIDAVRPGSGG